MKALERIATPISDYLVNELFPTNATMLTVTPKRCYECKTWFLGYFGYAWNSRNERRLLCKKCTRKSYDKKGE